jgi:MFS transporter, DHA2 family, methylenomycin A resistance protein
MTATARGLGAAPPIAWTVATTSLGLMVVLLDVTIVNVAVPHIGNSFGAQISGLQWIVDAYTLAFASLLLSAGAIADHTGSRRAFALGFKIFGAASLACALAPTHGVLIAARLLQGIGAALIIPTSLALISQACASDDAARSRAIGFWSAAGGVVSAAGPLIGGALMMTFSWRSIFFINLPICALALWMVARHVAEDPPRHTRRLDVPGLLAITIALVSATASVIEAGTRGWTDPVVLAGFGAAAVACAAFIGIEARAVEPMLPLGLFRQRAFSSVIVIATITNLGFYGAIFVLSVYFQQARGYSPVMTGLALLPFAVIMFANIASGHIAARWSPRLPVVAGLLLSVAGYVVLHAISLDTPYGLTLPGLLMMAVGAGLVVPAMTTCLLAGIDKQRAATASAALNTARQLGAAIGVAWLGAFVSGSAAQIAMGASRAFELAAVCLASAAALAAWGLRGR